MSQTSSINRANLAKSLLPYNSHKQLNASAREFRPQGRSTKASSKCRIMATIQEPTGSTENAIPSKNSIIIPSSNKKARKWYKHAKEAPIPTKLRGSLSVPKEFTTTTIPEAILEEIHDIYNYMDKAMALPDNKIVSSNRHVIIINFDFHDKKSKEELFCVIERKSSGKRRWRMVDVLFTAEMIKNNYNIGNQRLPTAGKQNIYEDISHRFDNIEEVFSDTQWQKVPVYDKTNNKQRNVLHITQNEFNNQLQQILKNPENIKIIHVLNPWINLRVVENMMIVKFNEDVCIGISFQLGPVRNKVEVTGIHLDKDQILLHHQLALTKHDCHCLDNFTSNIDDIKRGNVKNVENQVKALKKENKKLRENEQLRAGDKDPIIKYIKETLDGVSELISNDIKTALLSIKKIFNRDTIKEAIRNCLKSTQDTKLVQQQDASMGLQTMDANASISNPTNTPMSYLTTICGSYATTTPLLPFDVT